MKRKIQMLPLDMEFFRRIGADMNKVIAQVRSGVHINNLIKIIDAMSKEGHLPGDARMEWLYFDPRFNAWAVLITSEMYRELAFDEMAPLLEF